MHLPPRIQYHIFLICTLLYSTNCSFIFYTLHLLELEKNMGFKINTIQVDNGYEFVNDAEKTNRKTRFQLVAEYL